MLLLIGGTEKRIVKFVCRIKHRACLMYCFCAAFTPHEDQVQKNIFALKMR